MIVVGLMSGTSLDGISAAVVRFSEPDRHGRADDSLPVLSAQLLVHQQVGYSPEQRVRLEAAMQGGSARDYCRLAADLGDWLADAALGVMEKAGVRASEGAEGQPEGVAAIASHGQTLWHEPGHSTWQIGNASRIAERTGCAVISDFRTRDVAAGGQGAPLVPMADVLLFSHATTWRALQNLGGIGNVALVPPRSHQREGGVVAFDTGPGVIVIDAVTRLLRPDWPYDRGGQLAAQGTPLPALVEAALADPYFAKAPPKSTGREWFTPDYARELVARAREAGATDADIVATAVHITARSIADQYGRFLRGATGNVPAEPHVDSAAIERAPPHATTDAPAPSEVLLAGGGAQNPTLVAAITTHLARTMPGARVLRFDDVYFDSEAKEAVAFALLGYLHLTGRAGNVPQATGARGPRVLGTLTPRNANAIATRVRA